MEDLLTRATQMPPLAHIPGLPALLTRRGRIVSVEPNRELLRRGQPVDALLVPLNRALAKHFEDPDATPLRIRTFEVIALQELLAGSPCQYAVRAEGTTFVLRLPRQDFFELLGRHPTVDHWLRLSMASTTLRSFEELLEDRGLSTADIVRVFAKLSPSPVRLSVGQALPERASIWFVDSGELEVFHADGPAGKARVKSPGFFGGNCLVKPFRATFHALAPASAVAYEMPAREACAILSELDLVEPLLDEPHLREVAPPTREPSALDEAALPGSPCAAAALRFGLGLGAGRPLEQARTVRQANVAAVINLLLLLGVPVNLCSLRTSLALAVRLTFLKIAEAIEPYGVSSRAGTATLRSLRRHVLPALVALDGRLYVLLSMGRHAILHDAARGFVQVPRAEFDQLWNGQLLEASPVDIEAAPEQKVPLPAREGPTVRTVWAILRQTRSLASNAALLSLVTIGLSAAQPWLAQVVLDEVLELRDVQVLISCAAGMVLATVVFAIVRWVQQIVFAEFANTFDGRFGELFYRRALGLPMGAIGKHQAGDILARLGDLEAIRGFFSEDLLPVVVKIVSVAIVSVILSLYNVAVALLALGLGAITVAIQLAIAGTLSKNFDESARANTRATSLVSEQVSAASTVKAFGAARALRERWEAASLASRELSLRNALLTEGSGAAVALLGSVSRIGGLWLAARAALAESASPGQILAISLYLNHVVDRVGHIGSFFSRLWAVRVAFDNVRRIFDARQQTPWHQTRTTMSLRLSGRIRVEHVGFRYEGHSAYALKDIDMAIYPRQTVALVGRSGCGKTTLAHLIAGNLTPTSGRIVYDGVDGEFVEHSSLRQQIGLVTQAHDLFQGSIEENIAFADDAPRSLDVEKAAQEANAAAFIGPLPAKYHSVLGEGGSGLSGGQMQRLSIARTLYRDPKILIFDEATSQLDAESEKAIVENMHRILEDRTSLIIAHRLSTIRQADVIFVMDRGRIVQKGTHDELLAQGGHYSELFADQDLQGPT